MYGLRAAPNKFVSSRAQSLVLQSTRSLYVLRFRPQEYCLQSTLSSYRAASSASSSRWKARQSKDVFAREAKVSGLKSRAAFKLLQINDRYRIFRRGDTVVDLGYAPGSWSQVAVNRTAPHGRVIGVDVIPAQPPRGVSTIQGDFLSPAVQQELRDFVADPDRGRPKRSAFITAKPFGDEGNGEEPGIPIGCEPSYLEMDRQTGVVGGSTSVEDENQSTHDSDTVEVFPAESPVANHAAGYAVDVVLSDMSEPWDQTTGFGKNSISDPYRRMMNTSGIKFRDHAVSMDLCNAAMEFCFDTLRLGGHFVCKFYQGGEDKLLETRLKHLFEKVHREKPEASREESREAYFVALRRRRDPTKDEVFGD